MTAKMIDFAPPTNVCFLIDNLYKGGTEIHLLKLIRDLDRTQVKPTLVLLDGENEVSRQLEPDDCEVVRLGIKSFLRFSIVSRAYKFSRFLRKRKIDVLHMCFPDSTLFGTMCGKMAGVPNLIRTRRNAGYWMTKSHEWRGRFLSMLITRTVANSEISKESVIRQERAPAKSVDIIPNGVELNRFDLNIAERKTDSPIRIGMVANLRPVKRISDFIKAAAIVTKEIPGLQFDIAGSGELESQLQSEIEELGLEDSVTMHGAISDVVGFFGDIDVLVSCSESEGLSNTLLEGMASGLPIVATDIEGNRPIVNEGHNGMLFPVGNVEDLADKIRTLAVNQDLRNSLGRTGREMVEENYDQAKMVRKYEQLYNGLPRRANNKIK